MGCVRFFLSQCSALAQALFMCPITNLCMAGGIGQIPGQMDSKRRAKTN